MTPEASKELDDYLNKRRNDGKILTGESPLFRKTYAIGSAKAIPISISSLKHLVIDLIKNSTLSRAKDGKRHNIQLFHGFRKRFNNILKDNKEGNIALKEKLMGHKGVFSLDGTYHNPDLRTLFEEFKNHIVNLTVDDSERDKIKIRKLESEKSELEKGKLEIEQMKKRIEELEFGAEARKGDYAKNMLKFKREKNRSGEVFSILWHNMIEMMGNEEEKRQFLKRFNTAKESGEKIDEVWLCNALGLKLEDYEIKNQCRISQMNITEKEIERFWKRVKKTRKDGEKITIEWMCDALNIR